MRSLILLVPALMMAPLAAFAADGEPQLVLKNHHYVPERLNVPAGVKFKLHVKNEDDTAEEFESNELNREKVVAPGQEITVFLGPLDAGEYRFFGDYHQDTAQGTLVAK